MASTRGTTLLRLLHQNALAQAARYQPAGAQLSVPAFATSPAQSILRRLFADGTQTIDRATVEAEDAARKGKEFAQEKTEQAKDKASDATETAKETASNVTDKVKEQAGKEMITAQEMSKDLPTKTKETATDIKEVGIEAAKAVKRDASKIAEKVGLKTPSE